MAKKATVRQRVTTVSRRTLTDEHLQSHRFAKKDELRVVIAEPGGLCCYVGARSKTFYLRYKNTPFRLDEFDPAGIAGIAVDVAKQRAAALRHEMRQGTDVKTVRNRQGGCPPLRRAWELLTDTPEFKGLELSTRDNARSAWGKLEPVASVAMSNIDSGKLKKILDGVFEKSGFSAANDARKLVRKLWCTAKLHRKTFLDVDFLIPDDLPAYSRPKDMPKKSKPFRLKEAGYLLWYLLHQECPLPGRVRWPLLILLSAGPRFSDAAGMHAAEIDRTNNVWTPMDEPGRKKSVTNHFVYVTKTMQFALKNAADGPRFFPAPKNNTKWSSDGVFGRAIAAARKNKKFPLEIRKFNYRDFRKTVITGLAELNVSKKVGAIDGLRQRFVGQLDVQANDMDSIYNGYSYYRELRDIAIFWEAELYRRGGLEPPTYSEEELQLDYYERQAEQLGPKQGPPKVRHVKPQPNKLQNLTPDVLKKLVWEKPGTQLAAELGVSDTAIAKRCKKLGIKRPPRGYWAKVAAGKPPGVSPALPLPPGL